MLASAEQVLAYFLPEAPAEMLINFDEVSYLHWMCSEHSRKPQNLCMCKSMAIVKSFCCLLELNIVWTNFCVQCLFVAHQETLTLVFHEVNLVWILK